MVPVASLLNPPSPSTDRQLDTVEPTTQSSTLEYPSAALTLKKKKMAKRGGTPGKGQSNGEVNYPPFENLDKLTAAEYQRFDVQPVGHIGERPRRIPYSSDKKTFEQKTGRDGFEVYQYTFRKPGEDRGKDAYSIMWDYNIGLVRITALFKSLNFAKTMPGKVMSANPGLREISHSITGGSISAQGYWIPFEAAKAIAARLCYEIRYVLVPVFGPDFVSTCHRLGDVDFNNLVIDKDVIQRCTRNAATMYDHSGESSLVHGPRTPSPFASLPIWPPSKALRPKLFEPMDIESGYGTDTDRSEQNPGSPESLTSKGWTPVNTPQMKRSERLHLPLHPQNVTSTPWKNNNSARSPKTKPNKRGQRDDLGAKSALPDSDQPSSTAPSFTKRQKLTSRPESTMTAGYGAAQILIQLSMADAMLAEHREVRRRRASA